MRVTAQLIDARQDRHVWASNYEREMTDVLALQGEMVRAISGEIPVQCPAGKPAACLPEEGRPGSLRGHNEGTASP